MLRFSLFLSKDAKDATPIPYKETEIDIQHGAQVNEFFMCEVNPKGQVREPSHINTIYTACSLRTPRYRRLRIQFGCLNRSLIALT